MTGFVVAIPSYKRAHILSELSLPLLSSWGMPMDLVFVFCVKEDMDDYKNMISRNPLFAGTNIVEGPLGLHHMRNFICSYFPRGCHILNMDDDIKNILCMKEDTSVQNTKSSKRYPLCPLADTISWIERAFQITHNADATMWGIYPVRNGYFMKDLPSVTYDLRFCVGTFWGSINDPCMLIDIEEKEDFFRTLSVYEKHKVIVRFNHTCATTNYYHNPGGMQARPNNRIDASKASCAYLLNRWPQYCRLYNGKKNGVQEVRLKDQT